MMTALPSRLAPRRRLLARSFRLAAVLAALGITAAAGAQPAGPPLPIGGRYRVWIATTPGSPVIGEVRGSDSIGFWIRRSDRTVLTVPWRDVERLEESRGIGGPHARRGALVGALIGGGTLALLGAASTAEGETIDPGAVAGLGFVLGAGVGALVGGTVGHLRDPERWTEVALRPRVGLLDPAAARWRTLASVRVLRFR